MKRHGLCIAFVLALVLTVLPAGIRSAGAALDPLCDQGLFDQMVERARLQGQRRTAVEENLIYKPDSVLEYTCFDTGVNPVSAYLAGNFGHEYLGGRAPAGLPITYTGPVCDAMTVIWDAARCMNFSPVDPEDNYYDLNAFMTAPEIRRFPTTCTVPPSVAFGSVVATATPIAFTPATSPLTPATDCGLPIPTGNVIDISVGPGETRPARFNEKLCPNPTCTYIPTGFDAGNCVP